MAFNILYRKLFLLDNLQEASMGVSSAFGFLYTLAVLRIYGTGIAEKRVVSEDATALFMEEDAMMTAPCVVGLGQE